MKYICHFVTLRFQDIFVEAPNKAFALCVSRQGLGPLRPEGSARRCTQGQADRSHRGPAERQWGVRFLCDMIPITAEGPWAPSHAQFLCVSDLLFLVVSFRLFSSAGSGDSAIKTRFLDVGTEYLFKFNVFGGAGGRG